MIDIKELRSAVKTIGVMAVSTQEVSELLDRLEAAGKERDFAKVEIARLHDDIHELTDERDTYKAAHNEWLAKTEWVQDELTSGKLPAKYLGMHRADGINVEIDALRAKVEAAEKERDECNSRRLEAADHFAAQTALMKEKCDTLRAELAQLHKEADKFGDGVDWIQRALQAEAQIEQMERQEPVAIQHRVPSVDFRGECVGYSEWQDGKGLEHWPHRTLYALPGAQGEEK